MAIDRAKNEIIGYQAGCRGAKTGLKLWDRIKDIECEAYATDYWQPYESFIPKENHIQTKAETYTIEGFNSIIRHYLARFRRKTKCYSKSLLMVEYSLNLLCKRKEILKYLC